MATLTFKAGASWFTPNVTTVKRNTITAINIVDSYVITGNEIDSWDASEDNDGSIMCYVTGTTLTIAGNGSGTIKFNADQSYWLYSTDGKDYFKNCTSFTGLSLIDTSNCTTLNRSFRGLEKITSLDISHFDISNVTSLYQTFCYCKKLTSLPIENWDVSNVTTMAYTFYQTGALTLPVENWNVSNVTNLDHTFAHSASLNNIDLTKWDVSNVTNMNATFCGMKALTSLDLSTWDTSKVTCFPQFVEGCSNLETIYGLENFDTSQSVCFAQMFRGCSKLKELDLSSFDTRNADSGSITSDNGSTSACTWQMITNTHKLEKITLGKYFTFEGKGVDIVPAEDIGTLPTPSATYIEEADGNWYTEDFTAYAPDNVPNLTEMTYYASKKIVNDVIDTRVLNYKGLKYVLQSLNTVIDAGLETHTHSWDELENKPFGEIEGLVEILPSEDVSLQPFMSETPVYVGQLSQNLSHEMAEGAEFVVTIDGVVYAVGVEVLTTNDKLVIGNGSILNGGYEPPFAIVDGMIMILSETEKTSVTISVSKKEQITKTLDPKYLPENIQSDWNQSDETAPDYVKNRTHYETPQEVLLEEQTFTTESYYNNIGKLNNPFDQISFELGKFYKIVYDGTAYELECIKSTYGDFIVGSKAMYNNTTYADGDIPFAVGSWLSDDVNTTVIRTSTPGDHTLSIAVFEVGKLDEKFMPNSIFEKLDSAIGRNTKNKTYTVDGSTYNGSDNCEIFNNYSNNIAAGSYSHAEGNYTKALGYDGAHAEGYSTQAIGWASHAEGSGTIASGNYSHSEGYQTKATEYYAHAEGYQTEASDQYTHAEGQNSKATNDCAHAEGYYTEASGYTAHAEGQSTKAQGSNSHAEGCSTTASASESHAEGSGTIASGSQSHAEGYQSKAYKSYSHAEGNQSVADGYSAHAEGDQSKATGTASHAEGQTTEASAFASHAEGQYTKATNSASHSEGSYSEATGSYSHAEGYKGKAQKEAAHAEGYETIASGDRSHSEGSNTEAAGWASHAEGYRTKATADYQHVQGKYNAEDTEKKYAHIVGNGGWDDESSSWKYSNAHTLDWSGNAWYAGSVESTSIILSSPNGTRFSITVGDDGVLSANEIVEEDN